MIRAGSPKIIPFPLARPAPGPNCGSPGDPAPGTADPDAGPIASGGGLVVRLARTETERAAAQALRYRVFYEERGAVSDRGQSATGRDADRYDGVADHLLVMDPALGEGAAGIVGTYRLITQEAAASAGGFYTADEYDLSLIHAFPGRVLELGRSCVAPDYRTRSVLPLLWRGIATYVFRNGIDLMFGCASLHGTDPEAIAGELAYLRAHHLAPPALRLRALADRYVTMDRRPLAEIDPKRALATMPPLIKGYLRVGAFVGDGAVIDRQFNTIDVAIVVRTDQVTDKYLRHYSRDTPE